MFYVKYCIFIKFGPIEVVVGPFELKLRQCEATSVEQDIDIILDAIKSHT